MQLNLFPLQNFQAGQATIEMPPETNESPVMYIGGKGRAANLFMRYMPRQLPNMVHSPFFGMGGFELFLHRNYQVSIIGSDKDPLLCNFWNCMIENKDRLVKILRYWDGITERQTWRSVRKFMMQQYKVFKIRDCIKYYRCYWAAAMYHFVLRYSFGGVLGSSGCTPIKMQSESYVPHLINKIKNFTCEETEFHVECMDFEWAIELAHGNFLYLDPPYLPKEYSKDSTLSGNSLYVFHRDFKHEKLAEILNAYDGPFMLSYNNCQWVRDKYCRFRQIFPRWRQSCRSTNHEIKASNEILIMNY